MINPQTVLNNRYQVEKQIGEGGFAKVFLATDLQLGRQVAIKILSSQMAQDPEFLARFKQEARSIASFEHPTILSVYDYGEFEGDPYLVMPFIGGGTLQDRLKRGPIPAEEAGQLLEQISSALDYAHSRNVVHRDIKPQNMLIRTDGRLLLTDFGIAKLVSSESSNSMTRPMGTISYMAPEQFDGHVSRQSDIYSLGVVLYQILTGQLPFRGTTSQILSAHYTKSVPSLLEQPNLQYLPPQVVRQIDGVIQRAMAKNPQDRFHSASEFGMAYKTALTSPVLPSDQSQTQFSAPKENIPATLPMNMPYSAGVPYPTPPPEPYLAGRATANLPLPYGSQATQPPPGQFGSQSNLQPPARKNNTLLFALGGGVLTLVVIGLVLAVVLGGPKPNSATPTVVAIATATRQAEQPPTVSTTRAASTRQAIATTAAAANTVRSTPTPRPTTDPAASTESLKAPDGYLIFKNSDPTKLNLEIAHPKGWTPTLSDDGLEVDISDGTSSYTILREKTNTTSGTIEEYNARFVENLKKDGWVPKSEGTRYWGFAGEKWLQSSYQKGTNRAWGLFALHEGVPYAVVLTGEDSTFDDRLGNEFSQMFDNMHFLNTPINYFAGEMQSYSDPKGNFILNYPLDNWDLDKTSSPVTLNSKDQSQQFYIYTVTTSSLNTTDLLNLYKDKLANSGSYDDLKETERYKIVNLNNNNQEHYLRFSYSYKGKIYLGDLLIRKKSNQVYVGVALGNSAEELDSIYLNIWRYTNFLKG